MPRLPRPDRHVLGLPVSTAGILSLLCAIAFGVYLALWPAAPELEGDSAQYLEVARDLADGHLDALHLRTAGYPLLLVLTGSSTDPTRTLFYVSLLLHFGSVWLLAVALREMGVSGSGILTCATLLLLPPYVEPAALVMTENLAQFVLAVAFMALALWWGNHRSWWLLAAAVAAAFSAVVRPVYQLLSPALALLLLLWGSRASDAGSRRRHVRGALFMMLAWLFVVGGLATFNHTRFGWFGLAPSAGFHLSTKTMAFVERLPDEYTAVREILIRARDAELTNPGGTHTGTQAVWRAREELQQETSLSMPELSRYLIRMNLELVRRAPMEYLQEVVRSLALFWFPGTGRLAALHVPTLRWLWAFLHAGVLIALLVQLATVVAITALSLKSFGWRCTFRRLAGVAQIAESHVFGYTLALVIVLYTMVLSCAVDIGEPRQRRATDLLIIWAAVHGSFLWRRAAAAHVPQSAGTVG